MQYSFYKTDFTFFERLHFAIQDGHTFHSIKVQMALVTNFFDSSH
jgi:hypothetical protein